MVRKDRVPATNDNPRDDHPEKDTSAAERMHTPARAAYRPGPVDDASDLPNAESGFVHVTRLDLMVEEFPEGPYGAAAASSRLGKSTPWQPGQAAVSAHRDQNPVTSDRTVSLDEDRPDGPPGSTEAEN